MMVAMMVAMQVREYQKKGVTKKPKGFGPGAKVDKVSTSTCMVCLKPPPPTTRWAPWLQQIIKIVKQKNPFT